MLANLVEKWNVTAEQQKLLVTSIVSFLSVTQPTFNKDASQQLQSLHTHMFNPVSQHLSFHTTEVLPNMFHRKHKSSSLET